MSAAGHRAQLYAVGFLVATLCFAAMASMLAHGRHIACGCLGVAYVWGIRGLILMVIASA